MQNITQLLGLTSLFAIGTFFVLYLKMVQDYRKRKLLKLASMKRKRHG